MKTNPQFYLLNIHLSNNSSKVSHSFFSGSTKESEHFSEMPFARALKFLASHTYQVIFILKGIVQRGDPLAVPIHQHVALFPETSRL